VGVVEVVGGGGRVGWGGGWGGGVVSTVLGSRLITVSGLIYLS